MQESLRSSLFILALLLFILAAGTLGYYVIEGDHELWEAFGRTVSTITPMSLTDMHKLSHAGQIFSVVLVFCGVGSALLFATQFARILVASELQGVGIFTRRQMEKRIRSMRNHYIVCGFDEIAQSICTELASEKLPFVVVTAIEDFASQAIKLNYAVVRGNPTTDAALKEAGIERASGVIAAMSTDADNLFIALSARELNPQMLVIARGEEVGVDHRMLRAGADIVVSPMKLGGQQIARLIFQQTGKNTEKTVESEDDIPPAVLGFSLRVYRPKDDALGTVADAIEETGAVTAVTIQHHEGHVTMHPPKDLPLVENDVVVLLMQSDAPSEERLASEQSTHTVLLADDHRALRMLFARKIQSAGHKVIEAGNGEEALKLAQQHRPNLIVLDVLMPGMSGYEVCKALRASGFDDTPIILYSGEDDNDFFVQGQAAGANRCLQKSSKSSELLTEIETLLGDLRE